MNTIYHGLSPRLQQCVRGGAVALLLGVTAGAFAFAFNYFVTAKVAWTNRVPVRQISVTGEGTIATKPDIAKFTATVITQSVTAKDAQTENSRRSDAVIGYLKKEGVAEKDIKTIGYYISPQYQYDREIQCLNYPCPPQNPPKIASYEVRHSIAIKVRDLDNADDLLGGVVREGANEVGPLTFEIDDEERVKAEARRMAIDDAKEKAKRLAKDLQVRLGRITNFSESGGGFPIYARAESYGIGGDIATPAESKIAPGEEETKVFVTITYEFW